MRRAAAVLLAACLSAPTPSFAAVLTRAVAVPVIAGRIGLPVLSAPLPTLSPALTLSAPSLAPSLAAVAAPALAPAPAPFVAAPAPFAALAAALPAPADAPQPDAAPESQRDESGRTFDGLAKKEGVDDAAAGDLSSGVAPLAAASESAPADKAEPPFSKRPGFGALTRTHFLGVFNDTALKTLFMVWVTGVVGGDLANLYIGAATAAFTIPYVIFSSYAGPLSDRIENSKLIRWLKVAELGIVGTAAFLFAAGHAFGPGAAVLTGLVATMALMGTHSAFLSPAKERMLSKLVTEKQLGEGTARYNLFTFTGIVLGMLAGTALDALTGSVALSAVALLGVSGLGVWASRGLVKTAASGTPPASIVRELGGYLKGLRGTLAADWRAVKAVTAIRLVVMGLALYWFVGSIGQINMPGFVKVTLGLSDLWLSGFLATLTAGVGLGSTLAEKLQKKGVRLSLAVWGALTMSGFLFALGLLGASAPLWLAFAAALGLGAGSGLFNVPLNAQLLSVTPAESRGRYLGAANFVIFTGLAVSAVAFALFPAANLLFAALGLSWHLGPGAVFLSMGAVALLLAWRTRRDIPSMGGTVRSR